MKKELKIAFPRFSYYNLVIKYFVEQGLGQTYILQPQMTRRTLEIGSKYSPDTVCTPFKFTLGSMIEALDQGADMLVTPYGLCRLGYYGEPQARILRDLGYEFEMLNLAEYTTGKKVDYLKSFSRFCSKNKAVKMAAVGAEAIKMLEYIDEIQDDYYQNLGFEVQKGQCNRIFQDFLNHMETAQNRKDIDQAYHTAKKEFCNIELRKDRHPLRVGIIGEYYTVQDDFANCEIEKHLAELGVEVHRWMNVTHRNFRYPGEKNLNVAIKNYCTYEMGPTSTANIWCAKKYAEEGYDGIIHVKSAGCTPEIDIMPVLQNIGKEYKIPILYLTYDSQTSDTGLMTRIEAFYDMIQMRKKDYE